MRAYGGCGIEERGVDPGGVPSRIRRAADRGQDRSNLVLLEGLERRERGA
ncbi:MAG TPA: hypothetical protein VGJ60_11280 [Chloroflexota bacterium]